MKTEQATLILASLLRAPRRFRSYELSKAAKVQLTNIQQLLESYDHLAGSSDYGGALIKLNEAYQSLEAVPPASSSDDLPQRKHPFLLAFDNPKPGPETDAWKMYVNDLRNKSQ